MRMIVGLSRPDSGAADRRRAQFADLPNPGRRVGTLLDAAALHAGPHADAKPCASPHPDRRAGARAATCSSPSA